MTHDYDQLFVNDVPLIDVRAPAEFNQGAFPNAVNLPIMDDDERHEIGLAYKNDGHDAAVALGHRKVSGDLRRARIDAWHSFVEGNPGAHLYCFRGGQRSRIAVEWLAAADCHVPRIKGGYKAMRRYLIDSFDMPREILLLGGQTGCGKTRLLWEARETAYHSIVDLEALAHHRGSAFGPRPEPQPAQINFENSLAIELLKSGSQPVLMEDEGRMIGRVNIPGTLQYRMKAAPLLLLTASDDERVEITWQEYILDQFEELKSSFGEERAHLEHRAMLRRSLDAITKRLGGVRHQELAAAMNDAFDAQEDGDFDSHRAWIRPLLTDYYDPMYNYQLQQKTDRIVFSGAKDEILALLSDSDRVRTLTANWC